MEANPQVTPLTLDDIKFDFEGKMRNFFNPEAGKPDPKEISFSPQKIIDDKKITTAILDLKKFNDDAFNVHFSELMNCLKEAANKDVYDEFKDINIENTVYLEIFMNGGIKGLGKLFFKLIKNIASESKYKYIFLYPSQNLGTGQNELLKYYGKLCFKKIGPCYNEWLKTRYNFTDGDVPYFLMVAKIEELNVDDIDFPEDKIKYGGNNYLQQYSKYKAKYIKLKNKLK